MVDSEQQAGSITLREYVDLRIDFLEQNVKLANSVLNTRLEGMNEFRATITDRNNSYLTKAEFQAWRDKVEEELTRLREFKIVMDTKASSKEVVIAYLVTGIGLIISIASFILTLLDRV